MRFVSIVGLLGVLLLTAVNLESQSGRRLGDESLALAIEVIVEPDPSASDVYICRAVFTEIESGEVVAAPKLRFAKGEEAEVSTATPTGLEVRAVVSVAEDGARALFASEIQRGGLKLSVQSFAVEL